MDIRFLSLMNAVLYCFMTEFSYMVSKEPEASNTPFFDTFNEKEQISYIYAPGLLGSEILMGRYCPHFIAGTGEKITWKSGGYVIGQPHAAVTFPEINLKKPQGFSLNPLTSICNGIRRDLFPLAERFFGEKYGITVEDNPASLQTVANYAFRLSRANVAQRGDIKALCKTYTEHLKKYPETGIILYGDSRGAATVFNFIALYEPSEVKAAIVEGIFDDMAHVIKHFIYNDKKRNTEKRLYRLFSFIMRSYKKKGPFPRDYAETITDEIPLLFVTSLKDWVVSAQCTMFLYARLKERGHQKVHILVLNDVSHPCYMIGNAQDKNIYECIVHAFYKQYGLPHNRTKAEMGNAAFAQTQPSAESLKQNYILPQCEYCFDSMHENSNAKKEGRDY